MLTGTHIYCLMTPLFTMTTIVIMIVYHRNFQRSKNHLVPQIKKKKKKKKKKKNELTLFALSRPTGGRLYFISRQIVTLLFFYASFEKFLLYAFDVLLGKQKTLTKLDWRFNYLIFEYTVFVLMNLIEMNLLRERERELISCVY